jgi:hypothetical protein
MAGGQQQHFQIHLNRKGKRLDGSRYDREPSSRSRSILFIALGLAVASIDSVQLWIPENGFASLNPPLGYNRLGSLSTKTTHPAFLQGLQDVLARVGAHSDLHNPFTTKTKGEMFQLAIEAIGQQQASELFGLTNSCAHTGHPGHRPSAATPCGVCFGCVVRRAALKAANLPDLATYADPASSAKLKKWLEDETIVPAIRSFISRGVRTRDLLAMSLPTSYSLEDAANLCDRGVKELAGYVNP